MFGNRSFNVKLVKDRSNGTENADPNHNPYEGVEVAAAYAEVAKSFITYTSLVIGGVFITCKVVERICR